MSRIGPVFETLREEGRKALVTYIMAGDPDVDATIEMARSVVDAGTDILELGMPFSDPVADGPVIQRAGQRGLKAGMTVRGFIDLVARMREDLDVPVIHMGYVNPIFRYGMERFCQDAATAGVDGIIIPDLPPDEELGLYPLAEAVGIDPILLLAPTSGEIRAKMVCAFAGGFVYYVSRTGITGEQKDLAADLVSNLEQIRSFTDLPIAVGFGISSREQAVTAAEHADGVVIGSAVVRLVEEHGRDATRHVREFLEPVARALHGES